MEVANEHTSRYGIIKPGYDDGKKVEIKHLVEKPNPKDAPSNLAVIGRYILEPQVFDLLENQARGAGNEIQLTDALSNLLKSSPFYGLRFDGTRYDCGDKIGFLQANIAFALNRPDLGREMTNYIKELAQKL
jgi:UTP--glucose-1-phosphate uridylyltransferase